MSYFHFLNKYISKKEILIFKFPFSKLSNNKSLYFNTFKMEALEATLSKLVINEEVVEEKEQNISNILIDLIEVQKSKEDKKDIWKDSPYKNLVKLQCNNIGIIGESFIQSICNSVKIDANINGVKTKKLGGGYGDGLIKDKFIEIKTSHQGSSGQSFQHELGEVPWLADYVLFLDISPNCIYLTIFKNFPEAHYKSKEKCIPIFPNKCITWRKGKGAFKLDTSITMNETNIKSGYCFKITPVKTDLESLKAFIDSNIK